MAPMHSEIRHRVVDKRIQIALGVFAASSLRTAPPVPVTRDAARTMYLQPMNVELLPVATSVAALAAVDDGVFASRAADGPTTGTARIPAKEDLAALAARAKEEVSSSA